MSREGKYNYAEEPGIKRTCFGYSLHSQESLIHPSVSLWLNTLKLVCFYFSLNYVQAAWKIAGLSSDFIIMVTAWAQNIIITK